MNKSGIDLLADYVFLSKYSQKKPNGILENWNETVDRIYAMHVKKIANIFTVDSIQYKTAFEMLEKAKKAEYEKKILSSQRARQFASENENSGILKHEAKIYNCCSTYIDRVEVFGEIMYLLLCGCGVGYSLHKEYINKLPIVEIFNNNGYVNYQIEDSIEGWADSIKLLINSLFEGKTVTFDYDRIRPEGALIDNKFLAPGPNPLKIAHKKITDIFILRQGKKLRSIDIHDVICHIADSVVSGGIRRSAMIALFDKEDDLMLQAKTGNWYIDNPQRAMANNSILTSEKDRMSYQEMKNNLYVIRQFGEPGFVNVKNYDYTVNPCAEIVMLPRVDTGSGFAFCNLVEINAERISSVEEFLEICEISSFIATVQSLYINFKYLNDNSRLIAERDRAVGVSITGLYSNDFLKNKILEKGAKLVTEVNKRYAVLFGINASRTCTTIKPSGNASSILGLYCSGIHPAHANIYLRRVRIKTYSPEFLSLKDTPLVKILSGDNAVISFPVSNDNVIIKDNVSAIEHLKYIAMVKHYWINKGNKNGLAPNNVSATVEVEDDEWDEVAAVLFTNDHLYTGVSLLPKHGDQIYDNAPFQRLYNQELVDEYNNIQSYINNNEIDFVSIMSNRKEIFSGDLTAQACQGNSCELK